MFLLLYYNLNGLSKFNVMFNFHFSVNHPPTVTSKSQYFALEQEDLELDIDTVDPEGMPVSIALMDGSPKEAIVIGNVLQWKVVSNKTITIYLKATDACLASSTFNLTISLVVCSCKNNGTCLPVKPRGSGFYSCSCPSGFTGALCETDVNECQTYPCYQGKCCQI